MEVTKNDSILGVDDKSQHSRTAGTSPSTAGEVQGVAMTLVMQNQLSEVGRMHSFLQSLCREHHIDEDCFKSLNLVIEEWMVNVISYAYPEGTQGPIELTIRVGEGCITLEIRDRGVPFDPTQYPDADVDVALDERQIGGLGIYLMRNIMDSMHYERSIDGYNILKLTKLIK